MVINTIRQIILTLMFLVFAVGTVRVWAQELLVKIGHVAPITGNLAHLGTENENAARLAIEHLNAKKWKINGKAVRFELVAEDDAADPKQGLIAAQKLVDAKVNGVVGHLNSGTTIPASKIYHEAGIPQISPSSTSPKYTQQGFKTTFRVVANDTYLGAQLGRYAVNTLQAKSIAVIDDRTAYGQGVAEEFAKAAKKAGAKIVATEYTNNQATEFEAILNKVKAKNPDVVFYGGMDAQAGPLLHQMQQIGLHAKLMGGDGICSEELGKLSGNVITGALNGQVICAEAGGMDGKYKATYDKFRKFYKRKFNQEVKLNAPYVYDATMVLAEAMKKADSVEPAKYLPFMAETMHEGVTGLIEFDEKGDLKNGVITLYTYVDGKRDRITFLK